MRIILDGVEEEVEEGLTLARLIERQGDEPLHLLVEVDGRHVRLADQRTTLLREGSRVNLIRAATGG